MTLRINVMPNQSSRLTKARCLTLRYLIYLVMRSLSVIVFVIAITTITSVAEVFTTAQPGMWSARGMYLWPGPTAIADFPTAGRQVRITAPDRKTILEVGDIEARITLPN